MIKESVSHSMEKIKSGSKFSDLENEECPDIKMIITIIIMSRGVQK